MQLRTKEAQRIEHEIARTDRLTVEEMIEELNIIPTRCTYLYIDTEGHLTALEKPWPDTYPGDEAASIGYVRKLRGQ